MKENRVSTQVVPRKHGRSTYLTDKVPNNNQANTTFGRCQSKRSSAGISENQHFSEIEHLITPAALLSTTFGQRTKHCDTDHTAMRIHTSQDRKPSREWTPFKISVQRHPSSSQHPVMTTTSDKLQTTVKCSTSLNSPEIRKQQWLFNHNAKSARDGQNASNSVDLEQPQRLESNTIKRSCEMTQSCGNDGINAPTSQADLRRINNMKSTNRGRMLHSLALLEQSAP